MPEAWTISSVNAASRDPEILMDFSLSDDLIELKERTERFVRDRILPFETDPRQTALPLRGGDPSPAIGRRDAKSVPGRSRADYPRPRPGRGDRRWGVMDRAQRLELGHARPARPCDRRAA